jgi:dihydrofolate reductase
MSRRIVSFNRVTADGYFSTPDGNLDFAVPDDEIDKVASEAPPGPDNAILFGRRTYQMFEQFWPNVLKDAPTAPDPHVPDRQTEGLRAIAVWIDRAQKIVVSRTLKDVTWKNSRILRDVDPAQIEALKQEPGRDIMLFGSGSIASRLSALGLIDEYQFVLTPLLLGDGRPLISGISKRVPLTLLEAKPHASGNVMLRYAKAR